MTDDADDTKTTDVATGGDAPQGADANEGSTAADEADAADASAVAPKKKVPKSKRPQYILFAIVAALSLLADAGTKIWARTALSTTWSGVGHPPLRGGYLVRNPSRDPSYNRLGDCVIPEDIVPRSVPSEDKRDWSPCSSIPEPVIEGTWDWTLSMNHGSAFGFLSGEGFARVFFSVIGIGAVFGMLWMLRKARTDQKVLHWALALVAGGAVGNLIDRIYFGVVTDFVSWRYGTHVWPTFNVADVVLVAGVILMFIDIQKEGKRDKRRRLKRQAKAKKAGLVADLNT